MYRTVLAIALLFASVGSWAGNTYYQMGSGYTTSGARGIDAAATVTDYVNRVYYGCTSCATIVTQANTGNVCGATGTRWKSTNGSQILSWCLAAQVTCSETTQFSTLTKTCVAPPTSCPHGEIVDSNTQVCVTDPTFCDSGTYSSVTHSCVQTCASGSSLNTITVGGIPGAVCTPDAETADKCTNVLGYATGPDGTEHQICGDEQDKCKATGGTFGLVGTGADMNPVCLPADYGTALPTCDISSVLIVDTGTGGGGGFVCSSTKPPDDKVNPDVPKSETTPEPDKDGDGIPDSKDGDIDGDGILNGADTDADGDGVNNVDDKNPLGEPKTENSVTGGGSCAERPNCKGDAIFCSMNYQLWVTRCESPDKDPKLSSSSSCTTVPACEGSNWKCAMLIQKWKLDCENTEKNAGIAAGNGLTGTTKGSLEDNGTDLNSTLSGVYSQSESTSSCPSPITMSVQGHTLTIPFTSACDLAALIRPVVLVFFSFLAFRSVMSAF